MDEQVIETKELEVHTGNRWVAYGIWPKTQAEAEKARDFIKIHNPDLSWRIVTITTTRRVEETS